jgi:heterogeneous nuclear rnp K-like protein
MSASPTAATSSTKRPLEDPSSPAGPSDQPDAKRPALDKTAVDEKAATADETAPDANEAGKGEQEAVSKEEVNGATTTIDTTLPDAPIVSSELQPIQSTSSTNGRSTNTAQHQDESNWLHLRAVISTSEAATVIGKGGENVQQIRNMSGAKCTVSDYTRGAAERILTISGLVDAVSKVSRIILFKGKLRRC